MKRASPASHTRPTQAVVQPNAEHAELALREAAALMAPLALWLLRHGVAFPAFAEALKPVFVAAARAELARNAAEPTQSALSMLSGVHRKDVRDIAAAQHEALPPARPSLPAQVFTRWLADRRFRTKDGEPRPLPRSGDGRSFESLCRELSQDVHPRTVLDELLRLGLVRLDGESVVAVARSFVPSPQLAEMSALFAANVADHIAAAVSNLTLDAPKLLEQSIYADGLTGPSIDLLHAVARKAWAEAFEDIVGQARECLDRDQGSSDERQRMRFGVYFFSEPTPAATNAAGDRSAPSSAAVPGRRRTRIKP
ncbi:MAG TPA: DUF6502 family protein [Burkholderiaceae bacterium]|nr:DUF6502 family protein [Burkholderiaceae bacterium]